MLRFFLRRLAQDAGHHGRYGTEGLLCCQVEAALVVFLRSGMCLAGFPGDDSRCVPFCGGHAQNAWHLGRYGPEGQYVARRLFRQWHLHGWFCWFDAVRTVFPRLSAGPLPSLLGRARGVSPGRVVDKVVDMPVIVPTLVQTRRKLRSCSQLQFLDKVCIPVVVQRQALWEVLQSQSIAELVDILFGDIDRYAQC